MKTLLRKLVTLLFIVGILNSCVSNQVKDTDSEKAQRESERVTLSWAIPHYTGGAKWNENSPTIKYLNEKFNINLQLLYLDHGGFQEKLIVMAASGELPDMYSPSTELFLRWQDSDVFLDLKPLLDDYPNLRNSIPEDAWQIYNPVGKYYGLPVFDSQVRDGLVIREDWLDNLNIPMPNLDSFTIDEFYELAYAFAHNDPNESGQKDTVGFTMVVPSADSVIFPRSEPIAYAFGLANEWYEQDGELLPTQVQAEQWKGFLTFLRKAYAEGVLDQDFATHTGATSFDRVKGNKVGLFTTHSNDFFGLIRIIGQVADNPRLAQLAPPIGPNGHRGLSTNVIGEAKTVINANMSKVKQDKILEIIDWWMTDEGTRIMLNGIEDEHYKKSELSPSGYELTDYGKQVSARVLNSLLFRRPAINEADLFLHEDPKITKAKLAYNKNNSQYKVINPSGGFLAYSVTAKEKLANLNIAFTKACLQIILGTKPVSYMDEAIANWRANGGDDIIREVNEFAAEENRIKKDNK